LTVGVGPGERLGLSLSYDTRRFDAAGIERRLDELLRLLERIALDPEMVLGEPAGGTATGGARAAAITAPPEAAPAAADDTRPTRGVHELVAARASRTPAATAVVCGGRTLTYSAVEERARRFARTLRRRGARPEARVAVCLERSLDLPVVLLGILESGAAYLPLDPGSPPDRLRRLVDESRPALVVTERALRGRLPAGAAPHVIEIDAPSPPVGSAAADPPPPPVAPDHLAYVIYTSGSTGAPKGVQVTHGALASHALAVAERYALRPDDRVLQFAAPSFDVAAEELFPTLLSGAAVVLRDEGTPLVAADFLAWVDRERMTVLNLPAAYWHALVDALGDGGPGSLDLPACVRLVIVGSDEVSADRWSRFRLRFPGVRLINAYGPTEATITATLHEEGPGQAPPEGRVVPIGRPLPHVEALVLDSALRPVDEGAPGDLYLGGAGLARGYLSRPDLTAERFLPHPREPGARLYRTGDRVRRRADGALEFLGRGDAQVKVRGYRVEPAEIEAALERHPGIARAVVVAGEAASGGKRLLAYAVPRPGFAPGTGHLRAHLEGLLPAYMVPSAFVILERLPLTPGGKIDRRTLPAPAEAGPTPSLSGALPATGDPVPEIVAGIWADVLGRERVAAGDDFFSLGGHSLLAIQIVSRLRDAFGIDLPLRSLFDHPTVAGLSAEAERVRRDARGLPPVRPLRAEPRPASLPLSFAQERQWFLDQLVPDRPVYNINVALRLTGRLNAPALREALNGLVRRHETLRTVFASVDGRPAQVVHPGLRLSLPVVDLEGVPGTQREAEALRLATAEARRPFDLRRGPLLRTRLLRLSAERHVLLITMHHIVSDGWSAGVSARELAALYSAAARGEEPALAEPPIQYADFAIWQRDWLRGETLERQLAFWRR